MDKFGYPWFVAGGWAIDLFLNRETRVHEDIEIGIFRKNQMQLYKYFGNQKKYFIDNRNKFGKHEKHEWNKEYLQLPIHELYSRCDGLEIEILLNERENEQWIYRRNNKVRLDIEKAILFNVDKIPFLSPEIVILYKSKDIREKDITDINNTIGSMNKAQISWLIDSIDENSIKEKIRNLTIAST